MNQAKTGRLREIRAIFILLLTAGIWGFAFAAQRQASLYLSPFTFGAARFLMGAAALYLFVLPKDKKSGKRFTKKEWINGAIVGAALFAAATLQQIGIGMTSAGQAGFLSALYVVLVPIIGLLFGRKTNGATWLALLLAVPALYLLCMTDGGFVLSVGDAWLLSSAVFWALHILFTDRFVQGADPLHLCVSQFLFCGVLNLVCALLFETTTAENMQNAFLSVLYVGLMSTAVAYTLQAIGQRDAKPAHAALVLSMESVFSVIAGALLLGERMTTPAYFGCALMFAAVVLSQLKSAKEESHV